MSEIIYIAGKITNDPDYDIKFAKTEIKLKKEFKDCRVINPVKEIQKKFIFPEKIEYELIMNYCFELIKDCTHIYLLHDYNESPGAMREFKKAVEFGKEIIYGVV